MEHVFSLAGSLSQDITTVAGYPVLVTLVVVVEDLDLLTIHYLLPAGYGPGAPSRSVAGGAVVTAGPRCPRPEDFLGLTATMTATTATGRDHQRAPVTIHALVMR